MPDNVQYWLKSEVAQNFGDYLTQFFVQELFYRFGTDASNIHIIGSVICDMFIASGQEGTSPKSNPVIFWCCGLRDAKSLAEENRSNATILSVRGPLSGSELRLGARVPQGDPAFLLPALHSLRPIKEFQHRTICIPHFHDNRSDEVLRKLSGCDLVLRPNIANNPTEIRLFIDAIGSSEFVLSAAMHGALTAAAYGIPFAFWDNGQIDLPFKWKDVAALLQISPKFCTEINAAREHYETQIRPVMKVPSLWESLAVAPLLLRPSGLLKVLRYELSGRVGQEAVQEIDRLIEVFERRSGHADGVIEKIEQEWDQVRSDIDSLSEKLATAEVRHQQALQELGRTQNENIGLRTSLASAEAKHRRTQEDLEVEQQKFHRTLRQMEDKTKHLLTLVNAAQAQVRAIETSTAWKMTWPLRRVVMRMPRIRVFGRRVMTATWWVLTLQIGRLRSRRTTELQEVSQNTVQPRQTRRSANSAAKQAPTTVHAVHVPRQDFLTSAAPAVLIIDSVYPRPDNDSGSIDAVNFIRMFQSLGYSVIFIADAEFSADSSARNAIQALGVYCVSPPDYNSVEDFLRAAASVIDVCFLSRVYSGGRYAEAVKRLCDHAKIIFNTVDLHHLREEREARLTQDRRALNVAYGTREREFAIARLVDVTLVVSDKEAALLEEALPGVQVSTVPLVRECVGCVNDFNTRHGIGFIGGFLHRPNIDAVHYFLNEIWPIVRARLPDVKFYVMGADMPEEIRNRTDPGFVAIGYVRDLARQLEAIRVMVAPLRFGSGAKGKVVSSLAHGVPCVATSIAAEGMGLVDGATISVADTSEMFAHNIIALYTDEETWRARSQSGTEFVASNYSFAKCVRLFEQMLLQIAAPLPNGQRDDAAKAIRMPENID
jgi:glycosyltransferase involved in cell wall biosynthesis